MSQPFSVVCYVVAGFFLHTVMMLAFVNEPPASTKLAIMSVFVAPAAIALLVGLHASGYAHVGRDVGVVFVSAAVLMLFLVLTVACMLGTPEVAESFSDDSLRFFSDYLSGAACIATFFVSGAWLIWRDRTSDAALRAEWKSRGRSKDDG